MNLRNILSTAVLLSTLVLFNACRDEDLNPVPDWEPAVHGLGQFRVGSEILPIWSPTPTSQTTIDSKVFFDADDLANSVVNAQLQWISIDSRLQVSEIQCYIEFDEPWEDADRNPRTARHGGFGGTQTPPGRLVPGMVFSNLANRTPATFSVTPEMIYDLYKDATFDYGNGPVSVFNNPDNPRPEGQRFKAGDTFRVRWVLVTTTGLRFGSWSDSICSQEFANSNCAIQWSVK